jgi:hypothetical protein
MRVTSLLLPLLNIAGSRMAPAATTPDQAVFNVVRHSDPTLVSERTLYRNVLAPGLDLVIANRESSGMGVGYSGHLGVLVE